MDMRMRFLTENRLYRGLFARYGRKKLLRDRNRRCTLEEFEDRRMLAVTVTLNQFGLLTIEDESLNPVNQIVVSTQSANPNGGSTGSPYQISVNGLLTSHDARDVLSVEVIGNGGSDVIDLSGMYKSAFKQLRDTGITVYAGDGADNVQGGEFSEVIFGGLGNDVLRGGAGNDVIFGQDGVDSLYGETGDDDLDAGHKGVITPEEPMVLQSNAISGSQQLSGLSVAFNQGMIVPQSSLHLVGPNGVVSTSGATFSFDHINNIASWDLSSLNLGVGEYLYSVGNIQSVSGTTLDGDSDGIQGGEFKRIIKVGNVSEDPMMHPMVVDLKTNLGSDDNSKLEKISATFSKDVSSSIDVSDAVVRNLTTNTTAAVTDVFYDAATKTATWNIQTPPEKEGYYVFELNGSGIEDSSGKKLAGDVSSPGTQFKQSTIVTYKGDMNLDGFVSLTEAEAVLDSIGETGVGWRQGDFTGDQSVAPLDGLAAASNIGQAIGGTTNLSAEHMYGDEGNDNFRILTPQGTEYVELYDTEGVDRVDLSRINYTGTTQVVFDLDLVDQAFIRGATTNDKLYVRLGTLHQFENILGSPKNDVLRGDLLNNVLSGGNGNDSLEGRLGDDDLIGGLGNDTYKFTTVSGASSQGLGTDGVRERSGQGTDLLDFTNLGASTGIRLDLSSPYHQTVAMIPQRNYLRFQPIQGQEIENAIGTTLSDVIAGNERNNNLNGGGGTGKDFLFGRGGQDNLTAPVGSHLFYGLGSESTPDLNVAILEPIPPNFIHGKVFDDVNANAVKDGTDVFLEDWLVFDDTNQNRIRDEFEPFRYTAESGLYWFEVPVSGLDSTHFVRQGLRSDWRQTFLSADDVDGAHQFAPNTGTPANTQSDFGVTRVATRLLQEETRFLTTYVYEGQQTVGNLSSYRISIGDPHFDLADGSGVNDAFELAFLFADGDGSAGRSVIPTIGEGRDAFFNWTEGHAPVLADNVTFEDTPSGLNHIDVDLSHVQAGTRISLVARLLNNDGLPNLDTRTWIEFSGSIVQNSASVPLTGTYFAAPIRDLGDIDFDQLNDITSGFAVSYGISSFQSFDDTYSVNYQLAGNGSRSFREQVLLGVRNITDPSVTLADADGYTPDGMPFYNISRSVLGTSGDQVAEFFSGTVLGESLRFHNPRQHRFGFEVVILGQLNQAPVFTNSPDYTDTALRIVDVPSGTTYNHIISANDPDSDAFCVTMDSAPATASFSTQGVNSTHQTCDFDNTEVGEEEAARDFGRTRTFSFTANTAQIGQQFPITLRAEDEFGAVSWQHFTVRVVPSVEIARLSFRNLPHRMLPTLVKPIDTTRLPGIRMDMM
jgi:Ca2+-binding RTX toxin-like protein